MTTEGAPRDPVMKALGKELTRLQTEQDLPLRGLDRRLIEMFGEKSPSLQTLATIHAGVGTAARANLRVIGQICAGYGVSISDVSPELGRMAEDLIGLLTRSNCNDVWAAQELCDAAA